MTAFVEPSKKRRKIEKSNKSCFKTEVEAAWKLSCLADVIFCIPIARNAKNDCGETQDNSSKCKQNKNKEIKAMISEEKDSSNSDDIRYREYALNSFAFIAHSKVFKTMLIDNDKQRNQSNSITNDKDGCVKIVLKDLDIETFEFIRDYCYGLQPKLNNNIIFKVLVASIKYMTDSMIEYCINYIRNERIVDRCSLFTFLKDLSSFEININCNVISKQLIFKIFNNNKVLQRYACEFWNANVYVTKILDYINEDILILLLQTDSFYMNESLIWRMVSDYIQYSDKYFAIDDDSDIDFRQSKQFGEALSKFVPFIRFDIIGLRYFLKYIKPLLLQHNLMTKSQLCDILLSWNDDVLYQEKFTLKRQRFLFEENYLTSIDDIEVGDKVDGIRRNDPDPGFEILTVSLVDRMVNVIKFEHETKVYRWEDVLVAKPFSICSGTNDRFARLQENQLVQFRNVFEWSAFIVHNDRRGSCDSA